MVSLQGGEQSIFEYAVRNSYRIFLCIPFGIFAVFLFIFMNHYSLNWPRGDDFFLIEFYESIFLKHSLAWYDFFTLREGPHPIGTEVLLSATIFRIIGVNFIAIVWLNFLSVFGAATFAAATVTRYFHKPVAKAIAWGALPAAMCHPFQAELLFEPNCIGWFLVNAILLLNATIIERGGRLVIPILLISLFVGAFCPAQGSLLGVAAALHLLLRYGRRYFAWSVLFAMVSCVLIAFAILAPSAAWVSPLNDNPPRTAALGGLIVYFVQIVGSAFSQRDPATLLYIGGATLSMVAVGSLYALKKRFSTPADRVGVVLMFASLAFLAMFAQGRARYGLAWATWEFHMSPLVVPLFGGLALITVSIYDRVDRRNWAGKSLALLAVTYVFASIFVSLPDATMRADIAQLRGAVGRHAVCTGEGSRYVVEAENLNFGEFDRIMQDARLMRHLCAAPEPAKARWLEQLPSLYSQKIVADPQAAAALQDLWELYQSHPDLLRAYPVGSPDTPRALLRWGRWQAETGPYDPKLTPHRDVFKNLKLEE